MNISNNTTATSNSNYAFQMINIHKSFNNGQIKANVGINLSVKQNEIHAIIGENGAGKSTLMSILFGLYEQDLGDIYIRGEKVKFGSSKDASKYNIGMVHQHFKLIDNYKVIDNIILGVEETAGGFIKRSQSRKKIQKLIDQYKFNINLDDKISNLTVGQQQKVEILKVLYRDSDILIFDEPTAVLSDNEIKSFLEILKTFKANGKTIVLITHKLHEIKEVADVATVIRKGEYVGEVDVKKTSVEEMAELMVGRKIVPTKNDGIVTSQNEILNVIDLDLTFVPKFDYALMLVEKQLRGAVSNLKYNIKSLFKPSLKNAYQQDLKKNNVSQAKKISFKVRSGEVFAIAGVEGNGQSALAEHLSGLKLSRSGKIIFDGKDISYCNIEKRNKLGISHVPEDRHKHGLVLDQSCRKNLVNNQIKNKPFSNAGFIVEYEIAKFANDVIEKFDVRGTANGTAMSRALSGGNQQKLIVGREITKNHKLIIMVQPTRGLDVGAIEYIHQRILDEKKAGNSVVLISYELDEILAVADTIAVISRNAFVGVGSRHEMTRSKIGELLAGEGL